MQTISFMSANFIARELDYNMTGSWAEAHQAMEAYFKPIDTFEQRFAALLDEISALGFGALDLYTGHLGAAWATADHIGIARELLRQRDLRVASLAGSFGTTPAEFEATCKLAVAVNTTILGGNTPLLAADRSAVVAILQRYGVRLALENHPERTPEELLAKIGDGGDGTIGAAFDTGWFATQGYDAVRAAERLGSTIFAVHLKDVLAPGAHETCRYGLGIVPVREVVETLERLGFTGAYSVEHEPETYDPSADCRAMLELLQAWLAP